MLARDHTGGIQLVHDHLVELVGLLMLLFLLLDLGLDVPNLVLECGYLLLLVLPDLFVILCEELMEQLIYLIVDMAH